MITITPTSGSMMNMPVGNRMPMAPPNQRYPHAARNFFQPFRPFRPGGAGSVIFDPEFDGKRLRKSAMRKTVDYNASIIKMLEGRVWQRDYRDHRTLQPDAMYIPDVMPPSHYEDNPINAVTTRFVKTATNKMRCPIFCMAWTPEGRRLVTGASSGEFTLWNGLTFNFETILQAHDTPVRTMVWSHNEMWMVTADHAGFVKYWQSNMNNVKMFMAHQEAIRGISFSPLDSKFASCSDDGTVKIWDFYRCQEERSLRGHGADVKCVHWHPQKGLIISGSKDNQQPVKLWDPKTGTSLATIHAHKSTVMDVKWNNNGNWFVTASRDHLLKLFDIRNLNVEVQVFRGHKKESSSVAWHPVHEGLFCSGGSDGAILFWHVGADKEVGAIEQAHDSIVWTLAWHPMGHILCSGSNDHTSKFWTRNRPGDTMRDKYNLNTLPASLSGVEEAESEDVISIIPGMGPEDKVEANDDATSLPGLSTGAIPGLDDLDLVVEDKSKAQAKKVPYSKPIPKNFQANWNDTGKLDDLDDDNDGIDPVALINQLIEQQPGAVPLKDLKDVEAIYIYGRTLTVRPGSNLAKAIAEGTDKMLRYIHSGAVRDMRDVIPYYENVDIGDTDEEESAVEHPLREHDFGALKELMDKQKEALINAPPLPDNMGHDGFDDDSHYRNDDSMNFDDDRDRDDSWDDSLQDSSSHHDGPSNRKGNFRNPAYRDGPYRDNWDRNRNSHSNRSGSNRGSGRDRVRGRPNRVRHRDWSDNDKSNRRDSPHRDSSSMMDHDGSPFRDEPPYRDSPFHSRQSHNEGHRDGFRDSPSNLYDDSPAGRDGPIGQNGPMGRDGPNNHNGPMGRDNLSKRDGPHSRDSSFSDSHSGQGGFPPVRGEFRGSSRGGQSAGGGFGGPPSRNKFHGDNQMDSYGPRGGDSQGDRGGMDNNSYYNDNDDWCDQDDKPSNNKDNSYNNHYKEQNARGGYRGGRGFRGGRRNWRNRQPRGNHL